MPNAISLSLSATIRQNKTGRPVRFELTEQTRSAVGSRLRTCDFRFWDDAPYAAP